MQQDFPVSFLYVGIVFLLFVSIYSGETISR